MMGRFFRMGLVLGLAFSGLPGCEHHRSLLRPKEDASVGKSSYKEKEIDAVESDTSKIEAVDSDGANPKSFFKNNRRTGGLSSEAREIEGHFGIH